MRILTPANFFVVLPIKNRLVSSLSCFACLCIVPSRLLNVDQCGACEYHNFWSSVLHITGGFARFVVLTVSLKLVLVVCVMMFRPSIIFLVHWLSVSLVFVHALERFAI